jgi:predicted dehydrogenase
MSAIRGRTQRTPHPMQNTALRVVIVGISHWHAPRYIEALRARGVRLVGVSDLDVETAGRRAQQLGCEGYGDTSAMLAAQNPDFAIALPRHDLARRDIEALAEHRVAALIEKPMGLNAQDAAAAANAVGRAGIFAAACLPNRHLQFWEAVDALRRDGRLGHPLHAAFRVVNGTPQRYPEQGAPWMLDPAQSGGGALRNLGAHGIDAALMLASNPLSVRGAVIGNRRCGLAIEDYAVATLASRDGFVATVEVGYSHAGRSGGDQEWRLAATGAYVVDANGTLKIVCSDGEETSTPSRKAAEVYRMMIDETLDRFLSGKAPVVTVAECASAIALLDDIYRFAEQAQPEALVHT